MRARCTGYPVYLATSNRSEDDEIAHLADEDGVLVYRGSLEDVLGRAVDAADHWGLTGFARLCGDRPFFCIDGIRKGLDALAAEIRAGSKQTAMLSNAATATPTTGLATEIIRTAALKQAAQNCQDPYQREHVTPILYDGAEYSVVQLDDDPLHYSGPGMAVDTRSDYLRLSAISDIDDRVDIPTREAIALATRLQPQG
jgi:spore coat polysaccharide biosynthesis protein SpsF